MSGGDVLRRLRTRREDLLADLERLVTTESPATDTDALRSCADVLAEVGERLLGVAPERAEAGGKPVLRFGKRGAPVLLLGHLDTVHPVGTLARVPCRVSDGRVYGPGVLDMKTGLVQGLYALAEAGSVDDPDPVTPAGPGGSGDPAESADTAVPAVPADSAALLVTSDEEGGSRDSRPVIEEAAREARAVFVLEPSAGGKLKTARKGVSRYELELTGRAAHAGLNPGRGANACLGLAHAALVAADLADDAAGTTVTPTTATAGISANTVPDTARLALDVRAATASEQERVDRALRALAEPLAGVRLTVHGGINRPPMHSSAALELFQRARDVADRLGLGPIDAQHVGGGSDGNLTAALGVPTLDGLGGVGAGAHTEREWADVAALPDRAALLAALLAAVCSETAGGAAGTGEGAAARFAAGGAADRGAGRPTEGRERS